MTRDNLEKLHWLSADIRLARESNAVTYVRVDGWRDLVREIIASESQVSRAETLREVVHLAVGKYDHLLNGAAMATIRDEIVDAVVRSGVPHG